MAAKKNSGSRKVERAMHEMKRDTLKSGRSGKKGEKSQASRRRPHDPNFGKPCPKK
jgi:hypothetical protein